MAEGDTTYFGLFSGRQRAEVIQLLDTLGVRFTFEEVNEPESAPAVSTNLAGGLEIGEL